MLAILAAAPGERKRAAFEFVRFAARPENVTFWSTTTGYLPVTRPAQESSEMQKYFQENPNFKVAVDQLSKTRTQDTPAPSSRTATRPWARAWTKSWYATSPQERSSGRSPTNSRPTRKT